MKFWRHLAVVTLVVAAVVAFGLAWEHSSAAGWITPPGPPNGASSGEVKLLPGGRLPPGVRLPPGARMPPGGRLLRAGDRGMWLNFSDVGNLTSTVEIVAAVMAGVIVLDMGRRRWRKARRRWRKDRRAAATSASSPGS